LIYCKSFFSFLSTIFFPPDLAIYIDPHLYAPAIIIKTSLFSELAVVVLVGSFLALLFVTRPRAISRPTSLYLYALNYFTVIILESFYVRCHGVTIAKIWFIASVFFLFYLFFFLKKDLTGGCDPTRFLKKFLCVCAAKCAGESIINLSTVKPPPISLGVVNGGMSSIYCLKKIIRPYN
tara:strand:- start:216 stop:752 length:537 start_codon:yes stop_codon:yes gene_type:complete